MLLELCVSVTSRHYSRWMEVQHLEGTNIIMLNTWGKGCLIVEVSSDASTFQIRFWKRKKEKESCISSFPFFQGRLSQLPPPHPHPAPLSPPPPQMPSCFVVTITMHKMTCFIWQYGDPHTGGNNLYYTGTVKAVSEPTHRTLNNLMAPNSEEKSARRSIGCGRIS